MFRLSILLLATAATALAEVSLPSVFGPSMVLQRDVSVPVWGTASPGEEIQVTFADQKKTTKASDTGKWRVDLDPMPASKPEAAGETLVVEGKNRVEFPDVLVGDVWVCSGQSNMQWVLANTDNAEEEIASADLPRIRLLRFPQVKALEPQEDIRASWQVCSPKVARSFSAVGFYFGRKLHQELNVPIGLIQSAWGGTPIESWISTEGLAAGPMGAELLKDRDVIIADYPKERERWVQMAEALAEKHRKEGLPIIYHADPGKQDQEKAYAMPEHPDSDWSEVMMPSIWEKDGPQRDGVLWYRTKVDLPQSLQGKDLILSLGKVDDFDVTYVNGEEVGGLKESEAWKVPREYPIPARLTGTSSLTIALRVFDRSGSGGFTSGKNDLWLGLGKGKERVSLAGPWKMRVVLELPPAVGPGRYLPKPPVDPDTPHFPAVLYNGMISPIVPYGIRGAIWYQGENNAGRAEQYRELLPLLIQDWRTKWKNEELPFGIVQLVRFGKPATGPSDDGWARLRDAQLNTAKTVPHTGLAVCIDLGDAEDVHPRDKRPVGERLARWALHDVHGRDIVRGGPIYDRAEFSEKKARITFTDVGEGLSARGGEPLRYFTIAGEDKVFHPAEAKIVGRDTVEVWAENVSNPVAVRYAWANNPEGVNLVNSEDLPASPFRTDLWLGRDRHAR
jgi:sialate O-acetylesterase